MLYLEAGWRAQAQPACKVSAPTTPEGTFVVPPPPPPTLPLPHPSWVYAALGLHIQSSFHRGNGLNAWTPLPEVSCSWWVWQHAEWRGCWNFSCAPPYSTHTDGTAECETSDPSRFLEPHLPSSGYWSRVWVGAGLGLALREGWVYMSPESWIENSKSDSLFWMLKLFQHSLFVAVVTNVDLIVLHSRMAGSTLVCKLGTGKEEQLTLLWPEQ